MHILLHTQSSVRQPWGRCGAASVTITVRHDYFDLKKSDGKGAALSS